MTVSALSCYVPPSVKLPCCPVGRQDFPICCERTALHYVQTERELKRVWCHSLHFEYPHVICSLLVFSLLLASFLPQAEEVNINNKIYHKKCLTCANCKRNLDISILAIGPDDDVYCKEGGRSNSSCSAALICGCQCLFPRFKGVEGMAASVTDRLTGSTGCAVRPDPSFASRVATV